MRHTFPSSQPPAGNPHAETVEATKWFLAQLCLLPKCMEQKINKKQALKTQHWPFMVQLYSRVTIRPLLWSCLYDMKGKKKFVYIRFLQTSVQIYVWF